MGYMEKELAEKLKGFWEERIQEDMPVNDLIIRKIAKHAVEHWELKRSTMKPQKVMEFINFEYFPVSEDEDKASLWIFLEHADISYYLENGESYGSGGFIKFD